MSTLALGVSGSPVLAADVVTNVSGAAGNASVALSWTAPNTNLPLAFDTAVNATVFHGGSGGDRDGNLDCPTNYAITGIGVRKTEGSTVQARCTKLNSDGTLNPALTSTLTWFGGTAGDWSYCSAGKVAVAILGGSNFLQSMALSCATPPGVSDTPETTTWPAVASGTVKGSACPAGKIVKGFYARAGSWIDQGRARCATFGTAPFTDFAIQ